MPRQETGARTVLFKVSTTNCHSFHGADGGHGCKYLNFLIDILFGRI